MPLKVFSPNFHIIISSFKNFHPVYIILKGTNRLIALFIVTKKKEKVEVIIVQIYVLYRHEIGSQYKLCKKQKDLLI